MTAREFIREAKNIVTRHGNGRMTVDTEIYNKNGRDIAEVIVFQTMPWGCDVIFHSNNNGDNTDALILGDLERYLKIRKN